MKKVLLSSVAVLAIFAFAAPVFANDAEGVFGSNHWSDEAGVWVGDTNKPATVSEIKETNDKDLGNKSEKWTRDANKLKVDERLNVDKGEAAKAADQKADTKAPAAAGQKALPKTSAVK